MISTKSQFSWLEKQQISNLVEIYDNCMANSKTQVGVRQDQNILSSSASCSGPGSVQKWTNLCALDITEGSEMVNNL